MNPNFDIDRRMDQLEKWLNNIADALSKVANNKNQPPPPPPAQSKKDEKSEQMISTKWFFVAVGLTNGIVLLLFIVAFIAIVFVVKHMTMNFLQYQGKMMQQNLSSSFVQPLPPQFQTKYNYLGQ
jgi:hypothetical protein